MKQYKYEKITEKCKKCIGCNRLEMDRFKGIWRCENYIKKEKKSEKKSKNRII